MAILKIRDPETGLFQEVIVIKGEQGIPGGDLTTASQLPIVDAGAYFTATNVEDALQEIGVDFGTVNATKADKYYPTIIGSTIIESTDQYHSLKVKSTHASAIPMVQLRDGDENGFDMGYDKVNASLSVNKTVAGVYDSTLLTLHSDFISYKGNTVWHAGNDGAGSGLDADLLDGQHGSYYAPLASPAFTGTVTGITSDMVGALPLTGGTLTGNLIMSTTDNRAGGLFIGPDNDLYLYQSASGVLTIRAGDSPSYQYTNFSSSGVTVGGTLTETSDRRLKTNIEPLQNSLEKVLSLQGVSFNKNGEKNIGLIAQDVQLVIPEVVKEGEYLSIAYGNLVGLLIEAVKELNTKLNILESKNNG